MDTVRYVRDPLIGLGPPLDGVVARALEGRALTRHDALLFTRSTPEQLDYLCNAAAMLRDQGKGRTITFSPKVFIPLTRLCRDFCGYCTFRQSPAEAERLYLTPEEVLGVAKAGQALGCTEALFTLGERPEQRYPEAREWLAHRGYKTTLEYVRDVSALVLKETTLLPHGNPGTMSRRELQMLKDVNASMGIMLENISPRLVEPGGPHEQAPSKYPAARIKTLESAGTLRIPFTTGILVGIGETLEERIDSLLAIRDLHQRYGHIQEVIIQNFRAKPNTPMRAHPEPDTEDMLWSVSVARLILGPAANVQVPPNLSARDYPVYLRAGINDWGGVSPLTIDYVNPEAPWPQLSELKHRTEEMGFTLRPRLPVYPEYVTAREHFLPEGIRNHIKAQADSEGYVRGGIERYVPGST